ncbi:MAG: hypothetical protein DRO67_08660 [Candidatus Asgardarchaeum californiense]|nr:MAG: hypothetical protein DRO67_08660 [Candidatus Asgardarchaeum californiense]
MEHNIKQDVLSPEEAGIKNGNGFRRPFKLDGITYKIYTPSGTAYITVNGDENNYPIEVMVNIGKTGSEIQGMANVLARYISRDLRRHYRKIDKVIETIKGIKSADPVIQTEGELAGKVVYSLPDAFAKALMDYYKRYHKPN